MKQISEMTIEELKQEIKYIATLLDEQPGYHEAYLADLTEALADRMNSTKCRVEEVLGEQLTGEEFTKIESGWKAFCEEPEKYTGSVVIEMIRQDLDEERRLGA